MNFSGLNIITWLVTGAAVISDICRESFKFYEFMKLIKPEHQIPEWKQTCDLGRDPDVSIYGYDTQQ